MTWWHGGKQCTQHVRGAEKKSWGFAIFRLRQKNRPSLFRKQSKANFEDAHATSRATTEQTTRLKFGWLRCPKPSSTTRLETPVSQTSPVVLADLVLYLIWVVDKITCWPKWVVPYLWEFALQCYVYLYGIGKWVVPYRLWRFSHKFEHSKSTLLILSPTHFIWCWYIALALRSQRWICLFWIVIAC